jgi:hypothetical protein
MDSKLFSTNAIHHKNCCIYCPIQQRIREHEREQKIKKYYEENKEEIKECIRLQKQEGYLLHEWDS